MLQPEDDFTGPRAEEFAQTDVSGENVVILGLVKFYLKAITKFFPQTKFNIGYEQCW